MAGMRRWLVALFLAPALVLAARDPSGDVPPPGYAWPRAAIYQQQGWADLVEVRLEKGRVLSFRLDRTPNPGQAPLGFSLAIFAAYLDTGPGGLARLPGAGFSVPEARAADQVVLVSGWGAELIDLKTNESQPLPAERRGDAVAVTLPDLKVRALYPVVGVYDPFAPLGFRPASVEGGIWRLKAPLGAPRAVDVVGPWPGNRLMPLGGRRPFNPGGGLLALLAGLFTAWGVLGLRR